MISFETSSYLVELPNPTFGNSEGASAQLVVRRSLSNQQKTYVTTSLEKKFNLTIENISIEQKDDLIVLLSESEELLRYIDMDSDNWDGYITNFPFEFAETYTRIRSDACKQYMEDEVMDDTGDWERTYSCTINFRGSQV